MCNLEDVAQWVGIRIERAMLGQSVGVSPACGWILVSVIVEMMWDVA